MEQDQLVERYLPAKTLRERKWNGPPGSQGRPLKGCETKEKFHECEEPAYLEVQEQLADGGQDLFNAADPSVPIIREKFEHRIIAMYRASGMTRKEIFLRLGGKYNEKGQPLPATLTGAKYSYVHLGNIMAQPWFRARVIEIQREAGMDAVEAALQAEVPASIEVLTEIRDNKKVSASARLTAAINLLDRGLGKPIQRIESKNANLHLQVEENNERIIEELKMLDAEFQQMGVGTSDK